MNPLLRYAGFAALCAVVGATWVGVTYWVLSDAVARDISSPWFRALSAATFPLVLVYYLGRFRTGWSRDGPPDGRERLAESAALGGLGALAVGGLLAPPDVYLMTVATIGAFVVLAPLLNVVLKRRGSRAG